MLGWKTLISRMGAGRSRDVRTRTRARGAAGRGPTWRARVPDGRAATAIFPRTKERSDGAQKKSVEKSNRIRGRDFPRPNDRTSARSLEDVVS